MTLYRIELHGAELEVIRDHLAAASRAIGRVLEAKPVEAEPRAAAKRATFPKPPRLPKGSPIGTFLDVDGMGECQVVCQGHNPGEYGVTNGRETAMLKIRNGEILTIQRFR